MCMTTKTSGHLIIHDITLMQAKMLMQVLANYNLQFATLTDKQFVDDKKISVSSADFWPEEEMVAFDNAAMTAISISQNPRALGRSKTIQTFKFKYVKNIVHLSV